MSKESKNLVGPEAQAIIQSLILAVQIAKFAKENNALGLVSAIVPASVSQFEILLQNVDNPILKGDFNLIFDKLKQLSKEFEQGKGSFLKVEIFDQYVINVLKYFLSNQ